MNDGFSRGDKKRAETLQPAVLRPTFAALDGTDSGLDLNALRTVSEGVTAQRGPNLGTLVISRYQRLRECSVPDQVQVVLAGTIVATGGEELAMDLDKRGYEWVEEQSGANREAAYHGGERYPGSQC